MRYEFFEHVADAKFRAYGDTAEKRFINAGLAMTSLIADDIKPAITKSFSVKGKDMESLLYNFLEELLFLFDSEGFLLSSVRSIRIESESSGYRLECEMKGDDASDYKKHGDVKAVTYNEMEIADDYVQVVVDL